MKHLSMGSPTAPFRVSQSHGGKALSKADLANTAKNTVQAQNNVCFILRAILTKDGDNECVHIMGRHQRMVNRSHLSVLVL